MKQFILDLKILVKNYEESKIELVIFLDNSRLLFEYILQESESESDEIKVLMQKSIDLQIIPAMMAYEKRDLLESEAVEIKNYIARINKFTYDYN